MTELRKLRYCLWELDWPAGSRKEERGGKDTGYYFDCHFQGDLSKRTSGRLSIENVLRPWEAMSHQLGS